MRSQSGWRKKKYFGNCEEEEEEEEEDQRQAPAPLTATTAIAPLAIAPPALQLQRSFFPLFSVCLSSPRFKRTPITQQRPFCAYAVVSVAWRRPVRSFSHARKTNTFWILNGFDLNEQRSKQGCSNVDHSIIWTAERDRRLNLALRSLRLRLVRTFSRIRNTVLPKSIRTQLIIYKPCEMF